MKTLPSIPRSQRSFYCDEIKKDIKYQAFSLGMQSVLLEAKLDEKTSSLIDALEQLVSDVIVNDINIQKLPFPVIEKVFTKSRIISIGGNVNVNFKCNAKVGEDACGSAIQVELDLEKAEIIREEGFTDLIELGGGYNLKLRQNTLETINALKHKIEGDPRPEDVLCLYFDSLSNEEEVWGRDDFSEEELRKWVNGLGADIHLKVITDFYSKLPYFGMKLEVACPECGHVHPVTLRGLNQLFR